MKEWLFFIVFLFVGLALSFSGIVYLYKEKDDPDSVKIYRIVSLIGFVLIIIAVLKKFIF